jgi:hypothetical protein
VRRDEIIRKIRDAAAVAGLECVVRELTNHTGITVGSARTTLTRTSKDLAPAYAVKVWKTFEPVLGKGWWT